MLKLSTLSVVSLALTAFSAHAGNFEVVDVPPASVAAPAATDWSGPYIGALASFSTGTQDEYYDNGDEGYVDLHYDLEGSMYGGFAGYNFQRGSLVFGVEAAYMAGDLETSSWSYSTNIGQQTVYDLTYKNMIDLKARAGFAAGKALLFAFVGGSSGQFEYSLNDSPLPGSYTAAGLNYGAGVDFQISDNLFVGAEYIVRDMTGDFGDDAPGWSIEDINIQSIQVRAGLKF